MRNRATDDVQRANERAVFDVLPLFRVGPGVQSLKRHAHGAVQLKFGVGIKLKGRVEDLLCEPEETMSAREQGP